MYRWGSIIGPTASCSSSNQRADRSSTTLNIDNCNNSSRALSPEAQKIKEAEGNQASSSYEESCHHNSLEPSWSNSVQKQPSSLENHSRPSIIVPVHKMMNKFKRSQSYSIESETTKATGANQDQESRFPSLKNFGRVFMRSTSEDAFSSLPVKQNDKFRRTSTFELPVAENDESDVAQQADCLTSLPSSSYGAIGENKFLTGSPNNQSCESATTRNVIQTSLPSIVVESGSQDGSSFSSISLSESPSRKTSETILSDLRYIYSTNQNDED